MGHSQHPGGYNRQRIDTTRLVYSRTNKRNEVTFLNVKRSEEPQYVFRDKCSRQPESESQESSAHPLTPLRIHPSPDCISESTLKSSVLPNTAAYIGYAQKLAGPKVAGRPALMWLVPKWQVPRSNNRSQWNTSLHPPPPSFKTT